MTKWISVEDRLPPYNKTVLVYYNNADFMARFPDKKCCIYTGAIYLYDDDDKPKWIVDTEGEEIHEVIKELVTHWMPLPEAPKESK